MKTSLLVLLSCLFGSIAFSETQQLVAELPLHLIAGTDQLKIAAFSPPTKPQLPDSGHLDIRGAQLAYRIEGKGTPCLVIGSSIYYPKTFSPLLREQVQMHFVDLRWFAPGAMSIAPDSLSIASIVEDVEEIRKAFGLEKPILMGHSIHGTIAMEYAKKYAQHLSAVVVIGSPSHFGDDTYAEKASALWETASPERKALQEQNWGTYTELDRLTGQEEAVTAYNRSSPQYWYDAEYDASWLWDDMTVHSDLTDQLFTRTFAPYDMFADMPLIPIPVFVGMGTYDYVIPCTLWDSSYAAIPDFELHIFDKSGHTPQLEESLRFSQTLITWLEEKLDK